MSMMLDRIQAVEYRDEYHYLSTLKCTTIIGFLLSLAWFAVMIMFAVQIFTAQSLYVPAVIAAVASQLCFIVAFILFLKNHNQKIIPELSTFFALLGLSLLLLSVITCMLHSSPVASFVTEQLHLLYQR